MHSVRFESLLGRVHFNVSSSGRVETDGQLPVALGDTTVGIDAERRQLGFGAGNALDIDRVEDVVEPCGGRFARAHS